MTSYNFRSLLVAAIVLSNCITWTASRHHYTHHAHRTRHRRQGAGLYLSGSYVIPGGEGAGWGEWGEVSPCSRTCGGGVASQKRICLQIGSDGRPQCQGGDTKYFSCQTQDCPPDAGDFRAEQCSAFDDKDFRGFKYKWVPYTKTPNPCELNCMPHGERFYYRQSPKVIDGTRCNDDSFDVCVDGVCQPVGCDMMLGSNAREDKCRECRGNGANCHTSGGIIKTQDLIKGYNDILLIPAGATTIVIEEIAPSNNYLALRNKNGTFYLNGHYHIDFPRSMMIAGALWNYERSQSGFAAPDKLKCLGPTTESLYLALLLQDDNVGIQYEYSVPTKLAPVTDRRYNWVHEEFTPCSASCGGGFQTRNVTCRSSEELEVVADGLCDEILKPATNQSCNNDPCPAEWVEGPWSECSKRCGRDGVRNREVTCQKIIANGFPSLVAEKECFDLHGPKPELFQECNRDAVCPQWFVGKWQGCNKLCDEGTQKRQVVCFQKTNGRIKVLDDQDCEDEKPEKERPCMLAPCNGVDWIVSEWSGCDTCHSTIQTRKVYCASNESQVFDDSFCAHHKRPLTEQPCDKSKLPPCEVQWYATQWSKCLAECGDGVKTRKVFCGVYEDGTVREVKDELCADQPKYNDTKPCNVPEDKCPYQWYAGPWGNCSVECDGGKRERLLICIRGNKLADCKMENTPKNSEPCNLHPCNAGELISVSTQITDSDEEVNLPYCDDEEDYPEVGLEVAALDTMVSDAAFSATYEPESTLGDVDTGSGDGIGTLSSLSDEDATDSSLAVDEDYTTDDTTSSDTDTTDDGSTITGSIDTESTEKESSGLTDSTVSGETEESSISSSDVSEVTEALNTAETTEDTEAAPKTTTDVDVTTRRKPEETTTLKSDDGSSTISSATDETSSTDASASTNAETDTSITDEVDTDNTESTVVGSTDSHTTTDKEETDTATTKESTSSTDATDISESTSESAITESSSTDLTEESSSEPSSESATTSSDLSSTTEESSSSTDSTVSGETEESSVSSSDVSEVTTEAAPASTTDDDVTTRRKPEVTTTPESTSSDLSSTIEESSSSTDSTVSGETEESSVSSSDVSEVTTEAAPASTTDDDVTTRRKPEVTTTPESTSSDLSSTMEESSSEPSSESATTSSDLSSTIEESSSSTDSTVSGETEESSVSSSDVSEVTTEAAPASTTDDDVTTRRKPEVTTTPESTSSDLSSTMEGSTSSTESSESTDVSSSTLGAESTTPEGSSTESSTTESGVSSTESSEAVTGSTTEAESTTRTPAAGETTTLTVETTTSESSSTTEASSESGSTTESSTDSSTESSESSTTTKSEPTTTELESSTTELASSTTEEIESSTSSDTSTEASTATSTTESTASTEVSTTTSEGSTESEVTSTMSSEATEATSSTEAGASTTESSESTTTGEASSPRFTFTTSKKMCKPRWKPKPCDKTEFGCCPDKRTEASGPFEKGCRKPRTCEESDFGCCEDGVSPAQGNNQEGCPVTPCEETLFGCCLSDNKTAAEGNDQDGCPPPPPACASSKYGCCADEETEATGPDAQGCPESETTTTLLPETTSTAGETTISSTEEGSTAEGGSTVEGSTSVTASSTLLEGCAESEFGCCYDNETVASGPDGQGCPCNATEFGCCPDGVSPAQGENQRGCQGPCKDSPHGCCPDNETPAHGPEFEGCCLLTAFGCCPDNRTPAEGPRPLDGCGCQKSQHGCCPNNVTEALGPNNEGCGCQYTSFGCCPDRRTAASGPDFDGCSCHTYQFGCCEDGVTIAKGPEQQGCHCRYSTYGCCGDNQTPATGPDGAGCDCAASKFGCCPDGQTPAEGTKFLGCTDVPENKQAVCSLSTDPGPCHNFTAMWFYDLTYGGCSRFWYGGCEGNGNKFSTKEECEDICVQPAPKDACKLPGVKGPCDDEHVHWYYNTTVEQCIPFRYGGCLGNANNFDTRELCQAQCEPDKTADKCNLPIEQGLCAGNFSSWGYNIETRKCEQFIWGGCEGNGNRFKTEAACQMRCNPTPTECVEEPLATGNCSNKEALWSFSQGENRCMPFYYTGCGGNKNRFDSRANCEQVCPSAYEPDKCTLPAETGECSSYREKWFYDTAIKRCRQFYYGGCGGNENNFDTEAQCENACAETVVTTTTVRPTEAPQQPQPQPQPEPEPNAFCFYEIDEGGRCSSAGQETRYAYDSSLGKCVTFQYLGCGGNQNNFPNEEYCTYYCHPVQDICQLPMLSGPCDDSVMAWFYDPTTDSCSQFTYGGCEGNDNRFESREACETRCRIGPNAEVSTQKTTVTTLSPITVRIDSRLPEIVPPECTISPTLEECTAAGEVWYFDSEQHECVSHMNLGSGNECRHTATFASQEACERNCGAFRGVDVCIQRLDPGPCRTYVAKVYFDMESRSCKQFAYGGCLGGANRFSSFEECAQTCLAHTDVCQLPVEQGDCNLYVRQWYYDPSRDDCNQFVYTGCGGNGNRFETRRDCESQCRRQAASHTTTTTTLSPEIQPAQASECITPSYLEPCGSNKTVFYYDSNTRSCIASEFGNCGHPNSYRSEEECERKCGAFQGINVCQARLDTGPCRNPVPKFYYDSATGSCQRFAYGGCAGGPNRFSTIEECEELCGDSGPAPRCLLEVDTGYVEGCEAPSVPRYHYSSSRADCIVFVYNGCGGNQNNFPNYQECRRTCVPSAINEVGCESYERQCKSLQCAYGVVRAPAPGGCESCACADASTHCEQLRQECDALVCPYGVNRIQEDGCERCVCHEDPCSLANCSPSQGCIATAYTDPATNEVRHTARCYDEPDQGNEVLPDCSSVEAECVALRCEFGVQHVRTADGCQSCKCVTVEIDCEPLREECERLKCNYGVDKTTGSDGCERCKCTEHPCANITCAEGERCVVNAFRSIMDDMQYSAECRTGTKPGQCPLDETTSNEVLCRHECNDDADCRGVGKCCRRGCSNLCMAPETPRPPAHNILTTTHAPDLPGPPLALPQPEPEVAASEGGKATLRCLFHGNPPPKITWRFGELTIDGNVGRYRLMSDGALEIVSLYRNDTGVYICVADNGLGLATQEITLVVNDPVQMPVGIAGDENAVITGELDKPLSISCLAYGHPPPGIFWERNGAMVAFNDAIYEIRGNTLLIRSLSIDTLGPYTCQAYNGLGKAASWVVSVRAYRPEGIFLEHEYIVPRNSLPTTTRASTASTREDTTTTSTTTTTERPIFFTVPVSTHVSTPYSTLRAGTELRLICEVDGYPEPTVYWSKDGARIAAGDRISISGSAVVSRLVIERVAVSDSGLYGCHADNGYTSHTDNAQINVQQSVVPAKCTDNPFFANCDLIVRSKFCNHKYYSKFCCKSCVEAGQLDPQVAEMQADQPYRKK